METDELLARIQRDGRLSGRNESRRVTCAVLTVLSEVLPAPAYRRLVTALPDEVRHRLPRPGAGSIIHVLDCRAFLSRIADRLHVDGPDAAFLTRAVLSRLNARGHGAVPARLAHLVPKDLRPLLRAVPPGGIERPVPAAAFPRPRPPHRGGTPVAQTRPALSVVETAS